MKTCKRCGERFTPFKPHHVTCFSCYPAAVRDYKRRETISTEKQRMDYERERRQFRRDLQLGQLKGNP